MNWIESISEAFGFLLSTGQLGQTAFTAFATSIAPAEIGSLYGWQFALLLWEKLKSKNECRSECHSYLYLNLSKIIVYSYIHLFIYVLNTHYKY